MTEFILQLIKMNVTYIHVVDCETNLKLNLIT